MPGRIPQHFIDDLLDRVDLVEVIDSRVPLRKTGRNFSACCPFHDEKTPSFSVNPDKQFFYCFGCGAGGNAIGFLMDYERMDFPEAVDSLASLAGLEVPREQSENVEERRQKRNIYELLERASEFYQRQLREHQQASEAVDYLKTRGLSGEIAKRFQIGYAPPGWQNLLAALGTDDENRQLLEEGGLVVRKDENKVYDRFRHRIIFPIRDNRGRTIAFGGRVLGDDKPKYLNSPETHIFHKGRELYGLYEARKINPHMSKLLIVEGYMDVVALAQHDITWACATLGTATSQQHLEKVFRHSSEVVFCFDGDDAGRKAAQRALDTSLPTMQDGRQARFLFLPEGEDPDTLVRKIGTSAFTDLIDKASPLSEHLFDSLSTGLELSTPEGRSRLSNLAAPLLKKLPNGVFKQLMLDALSERTGADRAVLAEMVMSQPLSQPARTQSFQRQPAQPQSDQLRPTEYPDKNSPAYPEEYFTGDPETTSQQTTRLQPPKHSLALSTLSSPGAADRATILLALQPKLGLLIEQLPDAEAENDPALTLLTELIQLIRKDPEINTPKLLGRYHSSPHGERLKQLLSAETLIPDEAGQEREFLDIVAHLVHKSAQKQRMEMLHNLENIGLANMSAEEKEQYRQLVASAGRKN